MAVRTEYTLMEESSTVFDRNGIPRYDIFTYPINKFVNTSPLLEYTLTEQDVYRFDLFILQTYGKVPFYRKFILWFNNMPILDESHIGNSILIPLKKDIDTFFTNNIV